MSTPAAVPMSSSAARAGTLAPGHLVRALRDEHAVLEDLVLTLERQRSAVARDDIDAVNDSVFAAHRLLGAYREARTRRRSVVIVACGGGEGSIEDLGQAIGTPLSDAERLASDDLRSAARRLVRAVDQNRKLLQAAMSSGDAFFRLLTGAGAATQAYPTANRTAPNAAAVAASAVGPRLMDLRG
ncbi:MAG: flagellar protein FlgN [Gemmatimonadetes bacterium]|nr:flagellar protein FlgN [Gemmatimonadota bacterium]